jgi:S1-C subfamily serine protease
MISRSGGYQGIGFAIPSNTARLVMDTLIKHGKLVHGLLGVVIQDIDIDGRLQRISGVKTMVRLKPETPTPVPYGISSS